MSYNRTLTHAETKVTNAIFTDKQQTIQRTVGLILSVGAFAVIALSALLVHAAGTSDCRSGNRATTSLPARLRDSAFTTQKRSNINPRQRRVASNEKELSSLFPAACCHADSSRNSSGNGTPDDSEIIRLGSCSQVPYGNLDVNTTDKDLLNLPLNELLIHLDHPVFVSPPNPDGATLVDIGLYVTGIADLDPGTNSFTMEGYMDLIWCDPRTRFSTTTDSNKNMTTVDYTHMYLEKDAAKELEEIWWPAITFVNELHPREVENQEVLVSADGTVEYREKFAVMLATNFHMGQFPFDTQVLEAEIESFAWNSQVVQFHIEQDLVGFSEDFEIPEHQLTKIEERIYDVQEPRDRHPFSELLVELTVQRNPTSYITKIILPLTFIVCISWAVFWMDGNALADRMAISFTGVLTAVAYQFVVAEQLPKHIYNTFLDNFVLISFILMILTVVLNIAVHIFHLKGLSSEGEWMDRVCRFLFPATFLASSFLLAGIQGVSADGGVVGLCLALMVGMVLLVCFILHRCHQRSLIDNTAQTREELEQSQSLMQQQEDVLEEVALTENDESTNKATDEMPSSRTTSYLSKVGTLLYTSFASTEVGI